MTAAAADSPARAAWRRFRAHRAGSAATVLVLLLILAALLGPSLVPFDFAQSRKPDIWMAPLAGGHLLGADWLGRDLLARLLIGLRVSLIVGAVGTAVALAMGVVYGMVSGVAGGLLDELMMRLLDVLYSMPFILFALVLSVVFGGGLPLILLAIAAVQWLTMARVVRGQTRSLRQRDFVAASRAIGVSERGVLLRHILPNLVATVVTYATLTIPDVILGEGFLSFLQLGVQEPLASLGLLLQQGAGQMEVAWWLLLFPAATLSALLLSLSLIGDALRDALDTGDAR